MSAGTPAIADAREMRPYLVTTRLARHVVLAYDFETSAHGVGFITRIEGDVWICEAHFSHPVDVRIAGPTETLL